MLKELSYIKAVLFLYRLKMSFILLTQLLFCYKLAQQ